MNDNTPFMTQALMARIAHLEAELAAVVEERDALARKIKTYENVDAAWLEMLEHDVMQ